MVAPNLKALTRQLSEAPRFLEVEVKQAAERAMKVYADVIMKYNSEAKMEVTSTGVSGAEGPREAFVVAATESNRALNDEAEKLLKKLDKEFVPIGTS